ncbi:hypothetical protein FAEPRAM212_01603 [Faecalibacterium prausnitzii M21/2]|uniref:Uncharacterized protein n=1 Tax=Faecalibacterium prausnitzii M21/2 TaxID=411485 RepID=A8SB96_9FIRM|nr:hypothetical protein FAEPRAM212_01603 [Faecalibacterium prausnitzii M21/2]
MCLLWLWCVYGRGRCCGLTSFPWYRSRGRGGRSRSMRPSRQILRAGQAHRAGRPPKLRFPQSSGPHRAAPGPRLVRRCSRAESKSLPSSFPPASCCAPGQGFFCSLRRSAVWAAARVRYAMAVSAVYGTRTPAVVGRVVPSVK